MEAHDLQSFSLGFTDGSGAPELARQARTNITLWHRRLGYLNCKGLDFLRKRDNSEMSFNGAMAGGDVCIVGKIHQLRKSISWSHNKVKQPF